MANRLFGCQCFCGNTIQLEKDEHGRIVIVHGGHRNQILRDQRTAFGGRLKPSSKTIVCDAPITRESCGHIFEVKCHRWIRVSTFKEVIL